MRVLSPALTAVKDTNQAHTALLLDLTAGAQQHHFASKSLTFAGNAQRFRQAAEVPWVP